MLRAPQAWSAAIGLLGLLALVGVTPAMARESASLWTIDNRGTARHWRVERTAARSPATARPRPTPYAPATALVEQLRGYGEPVVFVPEGPRQPKRQRREARRAFRQLADHASAVRRGPTPLDELAQAELSQELVARGAASLRANGVRFSLTYIPDARVQDSELKLEILPEGRHPLNRAAARLARNLNGLKLKYLPALLAAHDFTAMYRRPSNTVFVGHDVIAGGQLRRLPVALHELRHAHGYQAMRNKIPSPYHGDAVAAQGPLPKVFSSTYQRGQSLDELATYALTLRTAIALQSRRLRRGQQLKEYRTNMRRGFFDVVQQGLELSARTVVMTRQALAALSRPATAIDLTEEGGVVQASLLVGRAGTQPYRINIPLVKSTCPADPANRQLLAAQLRWTLAAAKNNLTLFRVAAKAYDRVQAATNAADKRTLLRALGQVMNQRAVDRDPSARPLELGRAVELFNRSVQQLRAQSS